MSFTLYHSCKKEVQLSMLMYGGGIEPAHFPGWTQLSLNLGVCHPFMIIYVYWDDEGVSIWKRK